MLPLYVTSGEPAGIGPDICLSLAARIDERPIVVLGDMNLLRTRAACLGLDIELIEYSGQEASSTQGQLYVEHVPLSEAVVMGKLNSQNAPYVLEQLRRSADYAMSGKSVGVATAPVQKSVINDAGIHFSGHTEYYQEFAGVECVVMMLATKTLRVALATTHLPLRAVPDAITKERLHQVIDILIQDLKTWLVARFRRTRHPVSAATSSGNPATHRNETGLNPCLRQNQAACISSPRRSAISRILPGVRLPCWAR